MKSLRSNPGVVSMGDSLYAIGGQSRSTCLSSAERLEVGHICKWFNLSPMSTARNACRAAALSGILFVSGGYDDHSHRLSSVERFDPRDGSWQAVSPMSSSRSSHGFVAHGNYELFAIGGFDGTNVLSSAEVYDIRADRWRPIAGLRQARCCHGLVSLNGQLIVIGGQKEVLPQADTVLSSVERYKVGKVSQSKRCVQVIFEFLMQSGLLARRCTFAGTALPTGRRDLPIRRVNFLCHLFLPILLIMIIHLPNF